MSLNIADLLSTPGASSLFDSSASAQASSLAYHDASSAHVDLSLVDFDYLAACRSSAQLHSIVAQLEHEPYPELLAAARRRLAEVEEGAGEAEGRRRREGEEKQAVTSELEQWIRQQKHKEQAGSGVVDIPRPRKQPPIRSSSKRATTDAAEPALKVTAAASDEADGGVLSEEESTRRIASEKVKGNEAYRAGEYDTAARHYSAAIALLPPPYNTAASSIHPTSFSASAAAASSSAGSAAYDSSLHTNLAMSQLRLSLYADAAATASAALSHSHGGAVKGWWRRAQAYRELGRHGEALRDYAEGVRRAGEGKVRDEMEREMRQVRADVEAKERDSRKVEKVEEEKRQVDEERKEKTNADRTSDSLRRMTIVEDDDDDDDVKEESKEKSSSQPVFRAPRGGMTIEVVK